MFWPIVVVVVVFSARSGGAAGVLRGPTLQGPTLRGPTIRGPTLRGPTLVLLSGPTRVFVLLFVVLSFEKQENKHQNWPKVGLAKVGQTRMVSRFGQSRSQPGACLLEVLSNWVATRTPGGPGAHLLP